MKQIVNFFNLFLKHEKWRIIFIKNTKANYYLLLPANMLKCPLVFYSTIIKIYFYALFIYRRDIKT